ncbi:diacylglycerol kinase family protein [Aminobacter sp. AP02]|uniref:diacylglycerol/lipid kinase family protein n=1 Tax=Aminobacter sp. AP02 TaxID=2135737 RepID=UPI000D6D6975|nr:diacylglycerol kinase family protein [Aminobacter sp. AP02]PWK72600.1 YegS/Rv2252/BmrU family lipid kinase [Aminobacter sp. AP02]
MKIGVVRNPVAGGGRLETHWTEVATALSERFGDVEMRETEEPGDGAVIARDLVALGCQIVVAAGGDGTISEVADGILQMQAETGVDTILGVLPCGTGSDFARGMGIPAEVKAAIARIAEGKDRLIDAGRISFIDEHGRLASRHFVNIASLGMSGATVRAVNADRRKGRVSAKALFFWRTVTEFLRYRFQDVRIVVDDGAPVETRVALVAVANERFFGGGMMIAPDAEPDDGLFDIVILRAASKLRLIFDIRLLYGGRHRNHPAITILRGRKVTVEPLGDPLANAALVDIDGESPGHIPATYEMVPKALKVRC